MAVDVAPDHLTFPGPSGPHRFHHVWLRDNCPCTECRIETTGERRLFTGDIRDDIAPEAAEVRDGELVVTWNDGHRSRFSTDWLADRDVPARVHADDAVLWDASFGARIPRFAHADVVATDEGQLRYLEALHTYGAAIVQGVPSVDGEIERFAEAVAHVREVAFDRVHDVEHDPTGYNAAHTKEELKPHTDLPSYHWPPSIQLLHFLVNQATGGESVLVDGWKIVDDLRRRDPEAFWTLTTTPVPYQLFSDDEDTQARAPMIQLDAEGRVATFRFSNQLARPIDVPFEQVGEFYRAYRKLARMVDSDAYKAEFKTQDGDLLTVHGHRVMHGRRAFDPSSGARHLQDIYMEFDDMMSRRRVLRGEHIPTPADRVAVPA